MSWFLNQTKQNNNIETEDNLLKIEYVFKFIETIQKWNKSQY